MASDGSELRRKILDASIALVAEQGVRAVSFREVARRAGVSHQTPYHHFGNHLGILYAIAQEGFRDLTAAMTAAAQKSGADGNAALRAAGIAYVTFARKHVGHFRVMFQRTLVDSREGQVSMEEADCTYQTLVGLATEAHRQGAGRGLSAKSLSHLAWSTVHGLATLLVDGPLSAKTAQAKTEDALVREVVGALSHLLEAE